MSLTSSVSDDGRTVTINVSGRFDFSVHREFREVYKGMDVSTKSFVVNMQNAEYMDSSALGMLLLLREQAGGEQANIKIINCNEEIKNIFAVSNFHRIFNIS